MTKNIKNVFTRLRPTDDDDNGPWIEMEKHGKYIYIIYICVCKGKGTQTILNSDCCGMSRELSPVPLRSPRCCRTSMEISWCRPCLGESCAGGELLGFPQGAAAKLDRLPACSADDGSKSGGPG